MVAVSQDSQKILAVDEGIPTIDMSLDRSRVSSEIVKACETVGFFKVVNHGVDPRVISAMEQESIAFFSKPAHEKHSVGPANRPFGYGFSDIGHKGDTGEVEYLLLQPNPSFVSLLSPSISTHPLKFSSAVNCYVEAIEQLACEILELTAEGLRVPPHTFSRLIRAVDSDCVLRLNHYPPSDQLLTGEKLSDWSTSLPRVGFGAHTDPQILTVLRSNGVEGLQVATSDGSWVPVSPDTSAFCVNVGDLLQVMTNGRFKSVRHRAVTTRQGRRMSTAYFAGPPLSERISPLPDVSAEQPRREYRSFTWADYKNLAYSLRLGDDRLTLVRACTDDHTPIAF
ncbi:PREDICTED: gibberellin 2-beta-dioxygenase 4 [Tarenaya hassleriana]|uniref:gibberellin 2-beta-dioxygenase 4 n=1 Tax=Tarenaya hassleriana TaxID=28532 RepID=UPI0008FD197A|nr:PREDICTED: gibberellin 2-beta-dioxygenase 4 [Tarenaya hassleriana]